MCPVLVRLFLAHMGSANISTWASLSFVCSTASVNRVQSSVVIRFCLSLFGRFSNVQFGMGPCDLHLHSCMPGILSSTHCLNLLVLISSRAQKHASQRRIVLFESVCARRLILDTDAGRNEELDLAVSGLRTHQRECQLCYFAVFKDEILCTWRCHVDP